MPGRVIGIKVWFSRTSERRMRINFKFPLCVCVCGGGGGVNVLWSDPLMQYIYNYFLYQSATVVDDNSNGQPAYKMNPA